MVSNSWLRSVITRVNTSMRPVELFGLAAADRSSGRASAFLQFGDIDAAGLEDGAVAQVDLVEAQLVEPVLDRVVAARQEAGADPVGPAPEPEIEAGRLDLIGRRTASPVR